LKRSHLSLIILAEHIVQVHIHVTRIRFRFEPFASTCPVTKD
jgi:hypothetical protein